MFFLPEIQKMRCRGAWVAQLVKHLPTAQVMISGSWDPVPGQAFCSAGTLLLPLPLLSLPLSLINKLFVKKTGKYLKAFVQSNESDRWVDALLLLVESLCVPELACFTPVWKKTSPGTLRNSLLSQAAVSGWCRHDAWLSFLFKRKKKDMKRSFPSRKRGLTPGHRAFFFFFF